MRTLYINRSLYDVATGIKMSIRENMGLARKSSLYIEIMTMFKQSPLKRRGRQSSPGQSQSQVQVKGKSWCQEGHPAVKPRQVTIMTVNFSVTLDNVRTYHVGDAQGHCLNL